jgi:PPOX class probable F420-dependent enzyme
VDVVMRRLADARVGRLATVGADGVVRVVPVCFALVEGRIVSAVDHKPKRTTQLARLRDIRETGRAVLLVDHYDDDDWSKLWWIRVSGAAAVLSPAEDLDRRARGALAQKYRQYRDVPPTGAVWSLATDDVRMWSASE